MARKPRKTKAQKIQEVMDKYLPHDLPTDPIEWRWFFGLDVLEITDGDTVVLNMDHGDYIKRDEQSVRLAGINCVEYKGLTLEKAEEARKFVEDRIYDLPRSEIMIQTFLKPVSKRRRKSRGRTRRRRRSSAKRGKFGRLIGVIWFLEDGKWVNLNRLLLDKDLTVVQVY